MWGIDSSKFSQWRLLFIVCHQNISPTVIRADSISDVLFPSVALRRGFFVLFFYISINCTQVPHIIFIYSMYSDTQLYSRTMRVRKMSSGWNMQWLRFQKSTLMSLAPINKGAFGKHSRTENIMKHILTQTLDIVIHGA